MNPNPRPYEKHGGTNTKSYRVWWDMIRRCNSPNELHYDRYGGRGIKVCAEWENSFAAFYRDMGEQPKGMTLDRIDNDKGYSKENCRWVTRWEQSVNRCDNVMMTVDGVTQSISEWARERNLPYELVYYRKHTGKWPDEKCLDPVKRKQPVKLTYLGKEYTVKDIAKLAGISITSVHLRIKQYNHLILWLELI